MKTRFLLAALALLAAHLAHAQSADAAKAAQRLMASSGLEVQLGGFAEQMHKQLGQYRGQVPDEMLEVLGEAAREAFQADALRAEIVKALPGKLKAEQMDRASAWLEAETGRRVTRAEEVGAGGPDVAAMRAFMEQVKQKPLAPARIALIRELIGVTSSEALNAKLMEAMAFAVMLGIDSIAPVEKRMGPERLRAELRKAMPPEKIAEHLRTSLPAQFSFTYREVSDADLAAYIAFLRGAVGKPYNDAVFEVFTQALVAASYRMGQLVDTTFQKRRT
jgi:hypothetical protein